MFACLDFETFFDSKNKYSLRNKAVTTESYVRDPRFRAHGCAIYFPEWLSGAPLWYPGDQLPGLFASLPWERMQVLAHHAQFDGLILSHHYGVRPAFWFDTLSMARQLLGNHMRAGLEHLAQHFGLGAKTVPYEAFDGRQWEELAPQIRTAVANGACDDVMLTVRLFKEHLAPHFAASEYPLVDATVRMFTEPVLGADPAELEKLVELEQRRKDELLLAAGVAADPATGRPDPYQLRSNDLFAERLREFELEPATKPGKNGEIYAFAATDPFMEELLSDEDPAVAALAEARLAVQSSIEETRTQRLVNMARRGPLCMYLLFSGAATTRWSGGDKINPQNLTPAIQSVIGAAAEDEVCVRADASQIECRMLNYMAGQWDVVERFRSGDDPYVNVASAFYGFQVTKEQHPKERQFGKVLELQCGYGSGGPKIARTARIRAGLLLTEAEGLQGRDAYRSTHRAVVAYWREAEFVLSCLAAGRPYQWGPMTVADGCIWLPNGAPLIYDTLQRNEAGEWVVKRRKGWEKLYGAKLVENVIQALSRVYIGEVMNDCLQQGLKIALMRHDDIVIVCKRDIALDVERRLTWRMSQAPLWAPGIPLGSESRIGKLGK